MSVDPDIMREHDTFRDTEGAKHLLHSAADELDSLRQKVAELEKGQRDVHNILKPGSSIRYELPFLAQKIRDEHDAEISRLTLELASKENKT